MRVVHDGLVEITQTVVRTAAIEVRIGIARVLLQHTAEVGDGTHEVACRRPAHPNGGSATAPPYHCICTRQLHMHVYDGWSGHHCGGPQQPPASAAEIIGMNLDEVRERRTELIVADATVVEGVQIAGVDPQHLTVVVDGLRIPAA
jgi:hypothetical protein